VSLTLGELARLLDGEIVRGDRELALSGIAALDEAGPGELSFLGNERYREQFLRTGASAVIVPPGVDGGPEACALLACANPSFAFGEAVKRFTAELAPRFEPGVHPRAVVDEGAELDPAKVRVEAGAVVMRGAVVAEGCEIGPNAVIGPGVRLGRDCRVMANVTIRERCVLGERVILQPGAVIGSDGYGYEFVDGGHRKIDQIGIVVIEDDVEIGANSTIDRARFGRTVIGAGTKIDNLVQVGHNCRIGRHNLLVAQSGIAGSARTGDQVVVAAQSGIAGHVEIGAGAQLAGRAGVSADLEGGKVYGGHPAVPHMQHQREKAALRKLPELLKRVRKLEKG